MPCAGPACCNAARKSAPGSPAPKSPSHLGFPVHTTGHLHVDLSLRALYSAADVFVIPSRQGNLPNTGGLPDIVANRVTGALTVLIEPATFAAAIRWVLEDPQRRRALCVSEWKGDREGQGQYR